MKLIATAFTHYAAVNFKRICERSGTSAKLAPVPRDLSSSCGVCVMFEGECPDDVPEDIERIVEITGKGYHVIYEAEGL